MHNRWTSDELALLKNNYQNMRGKELVRLFSRHPIKSIQTMAQKKLRVARLPPRQWLQEEIALLKNSYERLSVNELKALFPQFSWRRIREKAYRLGLRRPRFNREKIKRFSTFEKGWLAGVVDSEGSIILTKGSTSLAPRVTISNTNKEFINRLKAIVKSGVLTVDKNSGAKDCLSWNVCALRDVLSFLRQLEPYLIVKKEQAKLMIEFCELRLKNRHYTEREYEIMEELKKLNKRGYA